MELVVHRTPVFRPHGFTAHRMQRMTLTRRHLTRMTLPVVLVARRREAAPTPRVYAPDCTAPAARNWSGAASVLIMITMVVLAVACSGLHL